MNLRKSPMAIIVLLIIMSLSACKTENNQSDEPDEIYYTVTFNSNDGTVVETQEILENSFVNEPSNPSKEGYEFEYWYLNDESVAYNFTTPVTNNLTLNAKWKEITVVVEKTNQELIQEDIEALMETMYVSRYYVDTPIKGPVNGSRISWSSSSKYISRNGIVLPLLPGETETTGTLKGRFTLNGTVLYHEFEVDLSPADDVQIATEKVVPFKNLTTEYNVEDKDVTLLFEENGSVPYIKVQEFIELLDGFIDPKFDITYDNDETTLTIAYDYVDEEEHQEYLDGLSDFDGIYHLTLTIDTVENTMTTPDSGFYWGYVFSTATNYGRHIKYDRDNENTYYEESEDLVYDLDDYNMDAVMYDGDVVLPYYVVNQLFAGSSYYNVYYNHDGLYGIYSLPSYGTDEYNTIRTALVNETNIPADLLAHTFNFLGFSFNEFYGAQEIMGVEDYYDLLFSRKDQLLTDDASLFDDILFDIISKDIDEPHTSYGYPGYYNNNEYIGPRLTSLTQLGPRVNSFYEDGLYAVDDAIATKWNLTPSSWAADDPNRPLYWFIDNAKTSVVLSLDGFNTSDIQESNNYDSTLLDAIMNVENGSIIPNIENGNKYFFYNNSTQEYKLGEILIKGMQNINLDTYTNSLIADGYSSDQTGTYFTKVIGDNKYVVTLDYDQTLKLAYVGILQLSVDNEEDSFDVYFVGSIDDLVEADSAVYMEMYMDLITSESSNISTVLLDLTFNTGGNVGALYRVLGFVTDQPFRVTSIDADTNTNSISYVYIDGVPNYSHLNWGVIQSPATFSAANEMSTIFKENDLGVIIGTQSGGGASSITPILLPNGSAFTMSSNSINGYAVETGNEENPYEFYSNEFGVTPTVYLDIENFYNNIELQKIIEQYYDIA